MDFPALGFHVIFMSLVVSFYFGFCWFIFPPIYLWYTYNFNHTKRERVLFPLNLQLFVGVHFPTMWCDNQSTTTSAALACNPKFHSRTKHIELDVHFLREKVAADSLQVHYIFSSEQTADILTKALSYHHFRLLYNKLNLTFPGLAWGGVLMILLIASVDMGSFNYVSNRMLVICIGYNYLPYGIL